MNYTVTMGRWLNGKLNPNRVEAYFVRGKTKKDCLELLNEHARGCRGTTAYYLRQFAHWRWGTRINRPAHEGRGVWLTRDHGDTDMTPVWIEHNEALQRPDEVGSVARSGSPAKRESGPQQSAEAPRSPAKREIEKDQATRGA